MSVRKRWVIKGNTYQVKDDIKAFGCRWDNDKKAWITPELSKEDLQFKRLKGLVEACDGEIFPLVLTGQAKTIQDILNK